MITIKSTTLGNAWIAAMETVMAKGEDIFDEDVQLREIRNLYITIDTVSDSDPILRAYADHDRIELMKKNMQLVVWLANIKSITVVISIITTELTRLIG